jgi:putative ABC transport system ATP-binding protein
LLNIVAGLDRPDRGEVLLAGEPLDFGHDDALARWRRANVGFVFQAFHLLPYLTVAENVALPLALLGIAGPERASRAAASLESVGLGGLATRRPGSLSGGEMQRAAIARALIHRPALLVADEPTGNLDSENGANVLALMTELNRELGVTVLMATHAADVAAVAGRTLHMKDGRFA